MAQANRLYRKQIAAEIAVFDMTRIGWLLAATDHARTHCGMRGHIIAPADMAALKTLQRCGYEADQAAEVLFGNA